jgi:hypothetical protein
MDTYKVTRMFFNGAKRVIERGLSLEEARTFCKSPESSFKTAAKPHLKRLTKNRGPWFNGYEKE